MPTYEYVCRSCEHRFEQWQKMTDDPLQICPECGGHVRRVLYAAGIVFKGSGFYSTDHSASGSVGKGNGQDNDHKHEENAPAATTGASSDSSAPASAATDAKKAATASPATTTK